MKAYHNPPQTEKPKRESPMDFMLAFLRWKKKNPDRNVTVKAFAIIRSEQKDKQPGK